MRTTTPERGPIGGCLRILESLMRGRWARPAWALNGIGYLNPRARISDLRKRWGVPIVADSKWVRGRLHTTYRVPPGSRAHAKRLIRLGVNTEMRRKGE